MQGVAPHLNKGRGPAHGIQEILEPGKIGSPAGNHNLTPPMGEQTEDARGSGYSEWRSYKRLTSIPGQVVWIAVWAQMGRQERESLPETAWGREEVGDLNPSSFQVWGQRVFRPHPGKWLKFGIRLWVQGTSQEDWIIYQSLWSYDFLLDWTSNFFRH